MLDLNDRGDVSFHKGTIVCQYLILLALFPVVEKQFLICEKLESLSTHTRLSAVSENSFIKTHPGWDESQRKEISRLSTLR